MKYDADGKQFEEMLLALYELRDKTPSAPVVRMWWRAFEQYQMAEVRLAFDRFVRDPDVGRYPPTPAAVLGMIELGQEAAALSAFDTLWSAIGRVGPYSAVTFDDPAIMRTVMDLGGWPHICETWTMETRPFRQQEFCTRWKGYRTTGVGMIDGHLLGCNTDGAAAIIGARDGRLEISHTGGFARLTRSVKSADEYASHGEH